MVRTQLYIFTQNSTLGIQLHVSALYIGQHTGPKHVVLYPMYYSVCKYIVVFWPHR